MKNIAITMLLLIAGMLSPLSHSAPPTDSAYIDGGSNKVGVILCHGRGKHPTWKVVDPLRRGINAKLGHHTLSIQLPNDDKNWKQYDEDFPKAYSRIKTAIQFLKQDAGVEKVFLVGHSMGSRMASSYVYKNTDHGVSGLIIAGCRNNGGSPFNCLENVENLTLPILDIWGGGNGKDSRAARERADLQSSAYTQIEISGADHKFDGYDDELVMTVSDWIKKQ